MKNVLIGICLMAGIALSAQTTLPTSWSFVNPSPTGASASSPTGAPATYAEKPGWTTKLDVFVTGTTPFVYATGQDGNAACRLDAADEYVQIAFAEKPGKLSYYIKGTGISAPYFQGAFKVQESVDGNTWVDLRSHTSMTNGFVQFEETPASASRYIRFYYHTKVSGSNVALDNILLEQPGPSNEAVISVKQGTNALANGTTYVNGTTASTTFTISNSGLTDALTILSINIEGSHAADYTVSNAPTSVAANNSATFTLNFAPASTGSRKAKLIINSNDADNPAFTINLYGIGGSYASVPAVQPTDLNFTNLKAYTFNVTYKSPAEKPEGYIILRKKDGAITETPVNGTTYKRGDYIGSAQVAYIGTDTVIRPTYIVANSVYSFKVFAFNGPAGFENYLTTNPLSGSVNTTGKDIGNYYNSINSTATNFVTALSAKINPHDTVFYSNYTATMINNFYTRDTASEQKIVNCVYTGFPYVYNEPFIWWGNSTGGILTREHTYAQSWMPTRSTSSWPNGANGREFQEYNDLHHLYPADQLRGNNVRSNYPFGEVVTVTSINGEGKLGKDANGNTVYEPRDEQKGDLARALFYMCVAYNGINGNNWSLPAVQDQAVLKKWHFQDLPDAFEIARHEYVASLQKNRNPFIDSINFVCRINFSNMSWIANTAACGAVETTLQITAPVGGEQINQGQSGDFIKWTSSNIDFIKIELLIADTLYAVIAENVNAQSGIYNWQVPAGLISSNKAKIRLSNAAHQISSTSPAHFSIGTTIGIDEKGQLNSFVLYPNPTEGTFSLQGLNNIPIQQIIVRDMLGKQVKEMNVNNSVGVDINIADKGVYFIEVKTAKGSAVKKLIVR